MLLATELAHGAPPLLLLQATSVLFEALSELKRPWQKWIQPRFAALRHKAHYRSCRPPRAEAFELRQTAAHEALGLIGCCRAALGRRHATA